MDVSSSQVVTPAIAAISPVSSPKPASEQSQTEQKSEESSTDSAYKRAGEEGDRSTQDVERDRQLVQRDREVRAHEQAHLSAGGPYVGRASFTYERGSDGVNYAVGGEVSIDTSVVAGDPKATLEKAETIQRAANAPAEPSAQDRRVASSARSMAAEARAELAKETAEASSESLSDDTPQSETPYSAEERPEPGSSLDIYA